MRSLSEGSVPFGLYPWRWARDDEPSFRALQGGLLVAPILQARTAAPLSRGSPSPKGHSEPPPLTLTL
eukprot:302572-Prymnesium_polylepis.2